MSKKFIVVSGVIGLCLVTTTAYAVTITNNSTAGSASIAGALAKGSGTFVIDHPLDPKNKLLYHSFVESPDVKNIYDGIATLDDTGSITIQLPDYFIALNKDFRYLASPLSVEMGNLHVAKEVQYSWFGFGLTPEFTISGGTPGGRISWQVTGIRHDPYILARPIIPEVEKSPSALVDKGVYLFPQFYAK